MKKNMNTQNRSYHTNNKTTKKKKSQAQSKVEYKPKNMNTQNRS